MLYNFFTSDNLYSFQLHQSATSPALAVRYSEQVKAENPQTLKEAKIGLGGLIRCVLCLSSIRSIGVSVPPNFMAELVKQGFLTGKQSLHLSRMKSERDQVLTLKALVPQLGSERDLAISDVQNLSTSPAKAELLAMFASYLPESRRKQLLNEALSIAENCKEGYDRDSATKVVTKYLLENQTSAETTQRSGTKPELSNDTKPATSARPIAHERSHLAEHDVNEALTAALYGERWRRSLVLERLAPQMSETLLNRALEVVLRWTDDYDRLSCMGTLAPYLSLEQLRRTLEAVQQWNESYYRTEGLNTLLPHLSPELLSEALDAVLQWNESYYRGRGFERPRALSSA